MLTKTLLFLSLLAVLFVVSKAQTNCVLFDNCDDCIASPGDGCGWCETTGLCQAGNSVGPGGVAANCTAWYYDSCLAVDCFRFTSCASCVFGQLCGWCGASSTCAEGDRSGPFSGTCSSGYVFGAVSQCPASTSSTSTSTGRRSTSTSSSSSSTSGRRSSGTTSGGSTSSGTAGSTSGGSSSGGSTGGSSSGGSTGGSSSGGSTGGSGGSTGGSSSGGSTGGSSSGGSSSGRRSSGSTGGSTGGSGGSTGGSGGSTSGSGSGGSTSGGSPPIFNSASSAFSLSPASFLVAVIVLAVVNLLW